MDAFDASVCVKVFECRVKRFYYSITSIAVLVGDVQRSIQRTFWCKKHSDGM